MKRYFITGTDTDCGKTYATLQLLAYLNDHGALTLAVKPIATGCEDKEGELINSDAKLLSLACNLHHTEINPWRFKPPVSPHLVNDSITTKDIAEYCFSEAFSHVDTLLIEGAGGLMVPLNNHETWVDLLKLTNIPVILIVGIKLGCLNHALLTETALQTYKIRCAGWIANCIDPNMMMVYENIHTLKRKMESPLIARIDFNGTLLPKAAFNRLMGVQYEA
ncbi:dethiobiotin synthase [Legionella impletisoli]|uniref:ATP-dependent dethiobiotin synthetase BioD n=1 Tax=Legionella impletisoli TaxID=343510 RepID=A0A917JQF4_9GAMM|nr:dethiobiotin synthase [Legionella impletisoli]GGI81401.1 ATP-dependent dethiobiotin synthetase BioD [Legionella impletisoli]